MAERFLTIKPFVVATCSCCGAPDADTSHTRICSRAGWQAKQHQPLIHVISSAFKRLSIKHVVELPPVHRGEGNTG